MAEFTSCEVAGFSGQPPLDIWRLIRHNYMFDLMNTQDENLRSIWKQSKIPVIYRQGGSKPLLVRLPYARDNRAWLKEKPRQTEPEFSDQFEKSN